MLIEMLIKLNVIVLIKIIKKSVKQRLIKMIKKVLNKG